VTVRPFDMMEATASTTSLNTEEDYDDYTPAKLIKTLEVSQSYKSNVIVTSV